MIVDITEFRLKLYPKDFKIVRKFYEHTLQLPIINQWDRGEADRGVMFQVGPAVLEILSPEQAYRPLTGSGLSLEVLDLHALWDELKDVAPVVFEIRDNPWGDTSFCIADPEGFEITFFEKARSSA